MDLFCHNNGTNVIQKTLSIYAFNFAFHVFFKRARMKLLSRAFLHSMALKWKCSNKCIVQLMVFLRNFKYKRSPQKVEIIVF